MAKRVTMAAAAAVVLVVVALVVAQLVLPGVAATRVRDELDRYGQVQRVSVSAFPAVELLWHDADRVTVAMTSYRSPATQVSPLLRQSGEVGTLDVSAGEVRVGLLRLRDAVLRKRGDELSASGRVSEADLRAAVPFLEDVTPVASGNGALTLRGTASVLGVQAALDAMVAAQDGSLVVAPAVPLGGLAQVVVFSDPAVTVESVSGQPTADGFSVFVHGHLN
jgi:hypothetical protein